MAKKKEKRFFDVKSTNDNNNDNGQVENEISSSSKIFILVQNVDVNNMYNRE